MLLVDADAALRRELGTLLAEHYSRVRCIDARDVPTAIEALLVKHPDVVVTDLRLSGHAQGGFRVVMDAVSLGIPAVVVSGPISEALRMRLDELGVGRVDKSGSAAELFAAIDRAIEARAARTAIPTAAAAPPRAQTA